ncbi:protein of unknown function [Clostridium beijerinckii]|nr:protein of unknown function [Clostridium beijerinckii]
MKCFILLFVVELIITIKRYEPRICFQKIGIFLSLFDVEFLAVEVSTAFFVLCFGIQKTNC